MAFRHNYPNLSFLINHTLASTVNPLSNDDMLHKKQQVTGTTLVLLEIMVMARLMTTLYSKMGSKLN